MPVADLQETLSQIESGRADEVLPTLEYLAGLFPTSATAHVLLAKAYEAGESWTHALTEWQWASTLVPESPVVADGLSRCIRVLSTPAAAAKPPASSAATASHPRRVPAEPAAAPPPPEQDEFLDLSDQQTGSPALAEPTGRGAAQPVGALASGPPVVPDDDEEIQDLERLIAELESARITPDPELSTAPSLDLDDEIDDMVSETLARIYAAQKQYGEAARVYDQLAVQHPKRAKEFVKKAADMRSRPTEE